MDRRAGDLTDALLVLSRTDGSHALPLQLSASLVHNAVVHNLPAWSESAQTARAPAPDWRSSRASTQAHEGALTLTPRRGGLSVMMQLPAAPGEPA